MAQRSVALLETVHAQPGLTRAAAAQLLGIGTGAATELVARLAERGLLAEEPAPPTGTRGRPARLTAHPTPARWSWPRPSPMSRGGSRRSSSAGAASRRPTGGPTGTTPRRFSARWRRP